MTSRGVDGQPVPAAGTLPAIVVAEDDRAMRNLIATVLAAVAGASRVVTTENAHDAMDFVENHEVGVVVTDMRMPGADGLELLDFVKAKSPSTQVVLLTGHATVESAVRALKSDAYDYLLKPFENDELRRIVRLALERHLLAIGNTRLRDQPRPDHPDFELVGHSANIEAVRRLIAAAAAYDCAVFISGESGTGKELVARQIHARGRRAQQPFIAINCAAIPDSLIESELFGYRRGAFTGADRDKVGLFEAANRGTLFLDEINRSTPAFQAKLMRVLQDGSYFPIGAAAPVSVDVQVLAATNVPVRELLERRELREDLYYRLMLMEIHVPALRERPEDIAALAYHFLHRHARRLGKKVAGISTDALGVMMRYEWPGNVRELENIVQRMIILGESEQIEIGALPERLATPREPKGQSIDYLPLRSLDEIEAYFIRKTLRDTQGDRALTAEILGIDKSTLWRKIKRYAIEWRSGADGSATELGPTAEPG